MAPNGNNRESNNQSIGGDHGMDCLRAAFQTYGENVNYEFQEIRSILANISLRLDGSGVTSTINLRKTQHHNHPVQRRYCSKIEPPTFNGYLDKEAFLVWCSKVEDWLDILEVPEDRQAKYVACKLRGAVSAWWETVQNNRRRQGKPPVQTWRKMRKLLVGRFLAADYQQHHFQRYQPYTQGSLNVNEYNEKIFQLGSRCNLSKTPEEQTACYNMGGLRINIHERMSLTQMNLSKHSPPSRNPVIVKTQETTANNSTYNHQPPIPSPSHEAEIASRQKSSDQNPPRNKQINLYAKPKCFKCEDPSNRSNECRAWKSVNLVDECTGEEGDLDEEFEIAEEEGEHLNCVVQKVLYTTEEKWPTQHKNIFRPDCSILGEVCKFIIDDGSRDNIISKTLVQCLGLSTEPHPKPYMLGWIKEGPSVAVMEICHIPLSIGRSYEDTVRPWQYDVDASHHRRQSNYSFIWHKKNIVFPASFWSDPLKQKTGAIILLDKWKELSDEASKLRTINLLVAREQTVVPEHVPHELRVLLKEFWDVSPGDFPDGLLPLRIQHQVDLIPGSSPPNYSHYGTSLSENEPLKEIKPELLQNGFIQERLDQLHGAITFSVLTKELIFLGFVVGSEGVQVDEAKWSKDAEASFNTLKGKLSTAHVLDFSKVIFIECEATRMGIGSVFSQEHHPTAFYKEKLSPAKKKKRVHCIPTTRGRAFLKQERMMEYVGNGNVVFMHEVQESYGFGG